MKANPSQTFFTAAADKCLGKAKHHAEMAKAHGAMLEACEADTPDHAFHKIAQAQHEGQSEEWATMGSTCAECARSEMQSQSNKAMDFDQRVPMLISAIATENPNVRPIFRAGMKEFGKAEVPAQFAKIVAVDEEDEQA
jgi:hypothetical protein